MYDKTIGSAEYTRNHIKGVNELWAMLMGKPVFTNDFLREEYISYVNEMANCMFDGGTNLSRRNKEI